MEVNTVKVQQNLEKAMGVWGTKAVIVQTHA
jgi:hypothetical protein